MGLSLKDLPFRRLVQKNSDLAAIRREYQSAPTEVRRMAAQREYDSGCAAEILDETMLRMLNSDGFRLSAGRGPCPGAVLALAIDPTCAPALLTVGVAEYQLGRVDDAMELFLTLTTLPDDTEDLSEIIDQAGDFLLDWKDYLNAKTLYAAAAEQYADVSVYHTGLGYCFDKLGELNKAVACARRAAELEPDNGVVLSDLGWVLVEAKLYEEAERVLEKAVMLSPSDCETARYNLKELRRRMKLTGRRKQRGNDENINNC